jgi:hypothetical protein
VPTFTPSLPARTRRDRPGVVFLTPRFALPPRTCSATADALPPGTTGPAHVKPLAGEGCRKRRSASRVRACARRLFVGVFSAATGEGAGSIVVRMFARWAV